MTRRRPLARPSAFALAAALLVLPFGEAAGRSRGSTGADFLKISNGVRAVAMGSSYVAVGEDVYALYWNPAGIANLEAPEFAGSYVKLFDQLEGVGLYTGAMEVPSFPVETGNLGFGFMALTTGTFDSTDPQALVRAAAGEASDAMGFIAYGVPLTDSLSTGLAVKVVQRTLSGADASSFVTDPVSGESIPTRSIAFKAVGGGADVGLLWESDERMVSIGGAVQNIGRIGEFDESIKVSFGGASEELPMTFRLGGALRTVFWGQRVLLSMDLTSFIDSLDAPRASLGAEYGLAGIAFVRLGWEQPLDAPVGRTALDFGDRSGLASLPSPLRSGLGFRWKFSPTALVQFDYALAPFGTLGSVHHAAMLVRWNIPKIIRAVTVDKEAVVKKKVARPAMVIEPKQIEFEQPVKEWKMEIRDDEGKIVKTVVGTGLPPKQLEWDMTDDRGRPITKLGGFNVSLKAVDVTNKEITSTQKVASVTAEPQLKAVSGKPLYPEVVFVLPQGNYQLWQLQIQDAGRLVRTWEGSGKPKSPITWDGLDEKGKTAKLKTPKYSWEFVDEGGQKSRGERKLPQIDVAIKPEITRNQVRMVGIRFSGEGMTLTEEHHAVMKKAAQFLREHPGSALTIESYADVAGGDATNFDVAQRRADRVLQSLIDRHDLTTSRVEVRVFGRSRSAPDFPNLSGSPEEQRQRVDLVINVRR